MIIQLLDLQVVMLKVQLKQLNQLKLNLLKNKIEIEFNSQSFLQQQVRSMVGCLKYLGEKKWDLKILIKYLSQKKNIMCTTSTT